MNKILVIIFTILSFHNIFSQNNTIQSDRKRTDRFAIWLIPSAAENIYGFAIGPVGSEAICNRPYTKFSHGLNIQIIGMGIFQTFYVNKINFKGREIIDNMDSLIQDATPINLSVHNGFLLSLFGTATDKVNGVSVSSWMSMGKQINGISLNVIWNFYEQLNGLSAGLLNQEVEMNGLQLGVVNMSKKLRGLQIGIWNKNEKRSLPFLNWNFK